MSSTANANFITQVTQLADCVGQTPLVRLQRLPAQEEVTDSTQLLAKLEGNNPAGSVKDRPAFNMIYQAEQRGDIKPGDMLIEATSGNTGIALAMVAAMRGYPITLLMPTNSTQERKDAMAAYGLHLGTAFQLIDDILDYTAEAETMGKNVGDDLAEGKPTLPLINAIERSNGEEREILVHAITNASRDNLNKVLAIIEQTGSLGYTARKAQEQAKLAKQSLSVLPESPFKNALGSLADFSASRTH